MPTQHNVDTRRLSQHYKIIHTLQVNADITSQCRHCKIMPTLKHYADTTRQCRQWKLNTHQNFCNRKPQIRDEYRQKQETYVCLSVCLLHHKFTVITFIYVIQVKEHGTRFGSGGERVEGGG
jgi:hypothetical protein